MSPTSEPGGSAPRRVLASWVGAARAVRRRLLLHRRGLAALLTGLAVLVAARLGEPPAAPSVAVWTAAHDLSSGEVLDSGDLRRTPYPPESVPDGAIASPRLVLGRSVSAPLRRGQALTDLSVVAAPLLDRFPDREATPVRLADSGVVGLLRVGDVVDVVAADPRGDGTGRVLSRGAVVLALPLGSESGPTGQSGRLVLLAVDRPDAASVSASGVSGFLTLTLTH